MNQTDNTDPPWRVSSHSNSQGNCVEVASWTLKN